MTKRLNPKRGMATFTAIVMAATLGIALASIGAVFAHQAKRTRAAQDDAQLRQLLLAGAAAAQAGVTGELATPVVDARVWIEASGDATAVRAELGERRAEQVLVVDGGRVVGAEIR